MCWEGRRRLRGASLRIATTPAALSFVLLLSMRLDRSPTCNRPRICRRRRAWSGCGLRLSLVLWGVRRNARRIAGRSQQAHTQPRPSADVVKQTRGGAVLGDHEVRTAIPVIIRDGGASLLAIDQETTLLAGDRLQRAAAIAAQQYTAACIRSGSLGLSRKEILT